MILTLHVFIAIASLGLATYLLFKPSAKLLFVSYASIAATLLSGVYLVILEPAKMLHICVAGLVYSAVVAVISMAGHIRLSHLHRTTTKP